eukprot:11995751-Alexandrium_andersonii.AAC.1
MFNQSPAPWTGGDYRTHPSIMEITWGVLRGRASGKGVVCIDDNTRKQLLEFNVEAVAPSTNALEKDPRRRQRVVLPMTGLGGA